MRWACDHHNYPLDGISRVPPRSLIGRCVLLFLCRRWSVMTRTTWRKIFKNLRELVLNDAGQIESVEEPSRSHLVGNYDDHRPIALLSLAIPLRERWGTPSFASPVRPLRWWDQMRQTIGTHNVFFYPEIASLSSLLNRIRSFLCWFPSTLVILHWCSIQFPSCWFVSSMFKKFKFK